MTEMPAALEVALDQRRRDPMHAPPIELRSNRVSRGDLRVVRPVEAHTSDPRLLLVLSVDSEHQFAEVMLVHTAPEMACEVDGIVPPELSSAPYQVVVQTDLRGAVWTWQVGTAVGHLDEQTIRELGHLAAEGAGEHGVASWDLAIQVGPRLAGPTDPRWAFKKSEGGTLRRLTRVCTEALLDEGSAWLVDPGLLRPELLDLAEDRTALVMELLDWVTTHTAALSFEDADFLIGLGASTIESWMEFGEIGDLGLDLWTLVEDLLQRAVAESDAGRGSGGTTRRLVAASHVAVSTRVTGIDVIHHLGRKEEVPA